MSDDIDVASELETLQREYLIAKARKPKVSKSTGFCAYCNDRLDNTARQFCSPECRDDFELEQAAMHRHNGRC